MLFGPIARFGNWVPHRSYRGLMWGLHMLWILPTLELAFGMGSSKVLYQLVSKLTPCLCVLALWVVTPVLQCSPGTRRFQCTASPRVSGLWSVVDCYGPIARCGTWVPHWSYGGLMWGLYGLWVLPTLKLAFGMGSSKVLYQMRTRFVPIW